MHIKDILNCCDHTLLRQDAAETDVIKLCREAVEYDTAAVCISPCHVKRMHEQFPKLNICTVIGFPNGSSTTSVKVFETKDAIQNGADEIDMVINISWVKDKRYDAVLDEINAVKAACDGRILKVIIETCLLTEEEKIEM